MEYNNKIIQVGFSKLLEISQERTRAFEGLKLALIEDDYEKVKFYARELTGLPSKSNISSSQTRAE
jgi:hypothetical protein